MYYTFDEIVRRWDSKHIEAFNKLPLDKIIEYFKKEIAGEQDPQTLIEFMFTGAVLLTKKLNP